MGFDRSHAPINILNLQCYSMWVAVFAEFALFAFLAIDKQIATNSMLTGLRWKQHNT